MGKIEAFKILMFLPFHKDIFFFCSVQIKHNMIPCYKVIYLMTWSYAELMVSYNHIFCTAIKIALLSKCSHSKLFFLHSQKLLPDSENCHMSPVTGWIVKTVSHCTYGCHRNKALQMGFLPWISPILSLLALDLRCLKISLNLALDFREIPLCPKVTGGRTLVIFTGTTTTLATCGIPKCALMASILE